MRHGHVTLQQGTKAMLPVGTPVTITDPIHAYRGRPAHIEAIRINGPLVVYTIAVGTISLRCRREHVRLAA
jgi:hypothetical protein